MRKLFSLITAFVLCTSFVSAKTIYCKMEQNWWKVDGAAVGCHYWGTPGPGTSWPGVRMTPVEGETDLWSIDLDLEKVQNVIFTRVNPSDEGDLNWGAKTKDLQIPTDDKNLFTITTSKAVWGDPGCDGTWSKYTAPTPVELKYYITGNAALCGEKAWDAQAIEMDDSTHTFTAMAAGEYEMKITNGAWDPEGQSWGSAALSEECSAGVGDKDGNIHFIVETPNNVVVSIANGSVTVTGTFKQEEPAKTFDLTVVQDSLWSKDGAKVAAWIWADDLEGQWTSWATNVNDTLTLKVNEKADSIILVRCAPEAETPTWDAWNRIDAGEIEDCHLYIITDWNKGIWCERPVVETKYYAKNNWNGAAADDWSWLEMSATDQENIYMLDSVVFGGTGVNINDKADDADALYFAADKIVVLEDLDGLPGPIPPEPRKRDTIPYAPAHSGVVLEAPTLLAGDTIKLFFNAADSTLKAAIVGRPAPAPRKEFVFVAGEAAEANPALFAITWGKDGSNETVKLANKADDIYTAEILETVDSLVLVRCATGATEIIWDGEGKNIWNQTANYALCDTMYFESWVEETNLFAVTCEAPKPVEVKYYVTGNAALVGEEKAWQADAIEMVDYTHTFPMLAAGEYQLKVTDGTWEHSWGYDNLSPTVAVEGLYTDVDGNICFTVYTPNDVTVTFAQGYVVVTGDFTNPTPATPDFGLLVNGTDYLPGTPEDKDTYTEYAVNKQLTVGEFVQLYDNVNKVAWTVTPEGSGFTDFEMKNDAYYIKQAGLYQFYIKIPKEGMESGLYVGFHGSGTNLNKVKAAQGQRFNILGLPVDANYRGVVIMNGQTYLQ